MVGNRQLIIHGIWRGIWANLRHPRALIARLLRTWEIRAVILLWVLYFLVHGTLADYKNRSPSEDPSDQISLACFLFILTLMALVFIGWRKWVQARRLSRPANLHSHTWRRGMRLVMGLGILMAFIYLPPIFLLHILPRVDLPRQYCMPVCAKLSNLHESIFQKILDLFRVGRNQPVLSPRPFICFLTPMPVRAAALDSRSRSVRENAINSFNYWDYWNGGQDPFYADMLFKICREGSVEESKECFLHILGCISRSGWFSDEKFHTSAYQESNRALIREIRKILLRRNDPEMIFLSTFLYERFCEPEDIALLEKTFQDVMHGSKPPSFIRPGVIEFLFNKRPDLMPYDRLASLGVLPSDPAKLSSYSLEQIDPFLFGLEEHIKGAIASIKEGKTGHGYDPKRYESCLKTVKDERIADVFFQANRMGILKNRRVLLFSVESLSVEQRRRYFKLATDWLISLPKENIGKKFNRITVEQFRNSASSYYYWGSPMGMRGPGMMGPGMMREDGDFFDDAFYGAVERLLNSFWKDQSNTSYIPPNDKKGGPYQMRMGGFMRRDDERYNVKTYGELFRIILNDRGKRVKRGMSLGKSNTKHQDVHTSS